MAKDLTAKQEGARRAARKLARAAGKDWKDTPQEERRSFLIKARAEMKDSANADNPARQKAMQAAKAAGKNWKDLTREQRQEYLKQSR